MNIHFGPAGNEDAFAGAGHKSSLDAPAYLAAMGLNAYEYQCGRGVNIGADKAALLGEKAREHRREIGGYVGAQRQDVLIHLVHPLDGLGAGLELRKCDVDAGEENAAVLVELDAALPMMEQGHLQLLFQLRDALAEAGLRDIEFLRRTGDIPRPSHRDKVFQLMEVHVLLLVIQGIPTAV